MPKGTHTKFDQRPRKTRTVNRMNSSSPNRWSFSYPNWKGQQHLFLPIFYFKLQNRTKTGSIMGNWYSADHIAKDHIHTDITCNAEEPHQNYCPGTVSNRLLGGGALCFKRRFMKVERCIRINMTDEICWHYLLHYAGNMLLSFFLHMKQSLFYF